MQIVIPALNDTSFFIGEITSDEVDSYQGDNPVVDGFGYYLIQIDNRNPMGTGQVLAKFLDESAAKSMAIMLRSQTLAAAA